MSGERGVKVLKINNAKIEWKTILCILLFRNTVKTFRVLIPRGRGIGHRLQQEVPELLT